MYSNYKQALGILNRARDTQATLNQLGILDAERVVSFLAEEKEYLESREQTPAEEVLANSYYQALLGSSAEKNDHTTGEDDDPLFLTERQMTNDQEVEAKLLADVHSLEERLGLRRDQRWCKGSEGWEKAEGLVQMASYQKALDKLEGLIVARIFEPSRMNVSGTGMYGYFVTL
ncbi:hypothetical protein GGU10DRAFT_280329 [Lentinula aff. detonsa]|uniref:Uncharacterized protein n=1 Tax=Lentinula aff. detonsa TaxID=2804958 RepID=A0AA38L1J7_9AGAR|nr:hypothetical protein GGU10DRAFT_280329 [Lentinula aff. detonsa]